MITLDEIAKKVSALAAQIDAPAALLPTYGKTIDSAHPHIETDDAGWYHYVIVERGVEQSRKSSVEFDDLLFNIFSGVTFSMACDYELHHRKNGKDCRRLLFSHQEYLLGLLNENWKKSEEQAHQQILIQHPFNDDHDS